MKNDWMLLAWWAALSLCGGGVQAAAPDPRAGWTNLLANPGFEQAQGGRCPGWAPFEQGYERDLEVRHEGAASIRCVNAAVDQRRGATWVLELNQTEPRPIVVRGWSRAQDVGGTRNNDYAIYLDLVYRDGTPLWGQTAPFQTGTHDWERRQVLVVPAKPVRQVAIHALFRHHTGTAWFDDFAAFELAGNDLFDSQALRPPALRGRSGWFVRDVAAEGPMREAAQLAEAGLFVKAGERGPERWLTVTDSSGRDRAVTVYYVERFEAAETVWWHDLRTHAMAGRSGERANLTAVGSGATGSISLYPFGCVTGRGEGRAVALDPGQGPRVARIGYHAGARLLYAAVDLALTRRQTATLDPQGRATAAVRLAAFDVDPAWGFRSAAARYYRLYPAFFARRAKAEGLWIAFTDPAKVEGVEDFGIAYHEGDNSLATDDRLRILSFRYTEPMTYWMGMPKGVPRTYDAALGLVREHAAGTDEGRKRWAQTVLNSGGGDERGRYNVEFVAAPWSDGATWVLNPNPALPAPAGQVTKAGHSYTLEMADRMYGPQAAGVQDGEYLDSIEGWAQWLDYRPESLRYATLPLSFDTDTRQAALPTWFSVWEFARFVRADLLRRGKLLMANGTPWRFHAFAPLLDVLGTETNWLPGGRWAPDTDAVFNLRRTLSAQKPYLLLQNADFDAFGPYVERYFQRSMFYGVYPSFFSIDASTHPYWTKPAWYNRDRPLFKKYIPVVRRLSAAGWEPITGARSSQPAVGVERFGQEYLTVLNDSRERATATIAVERPAFGLERSGAPVTVTDAVEGGAVAVEAQGASVTIRLSLGPEEARALHLRAGP